MVEFWIQMSSFLILLLHFTAAVTGKSVVVRVGDEVTLSCGNVIGNQDKCERTDWVFNAPGSRETVELIKNGQIGEEAKSKSDRLSVTQNCSLVIKNVTDEDVGLYICTQFESGREDSLVALYPVTMTEHENNDEVTLSCSMQWCYHRVEWLYEGKVKDKETSQHRCSVNLTYKKQESKKYKSLNCEVKDLTTGRVQQFPFSRQTSGDATTTMAATTMAATTMEAATTMVATSQEARADCSVLDYIMLVMRVAELLLITVITVLLIRARGNQRPPEDNTVSYSARRRRVMRSGAADSQVNTDEDEDDGVVKYEN
ncbi:uncharacterized protein LOC109137507 isoform X2 [Larimichthys crocea]|uniref:uncharacterized protein LOC109137507 isoform X1 n=1 Tax=Larimichthys crocea TaxID=215358 RepID=UPI000F5E9305|nr:uncharacterized protein LOC109137507 isoform X1 [Larimichthys crocea]XP_027128009.1 uncharacterized protein LOC109137507 isoform X2 [Larimichthys crocea]